MDKRRKTRFIAIIDKKDDEKTRRYWEEKSPEERVSAVEFLREHYYIINGYKSVPRIKKKLRVIGRIN